jgi:hypothetical protein
MATIFREKGPHQWHAQVRRKGWSITTATLRTKKDAEAWSRDVESQMDRGIYVDRSAGERTTFKQAIERYLKAISGQVRPHALPSAHGLNASCGMKAICARMPLQILQPEHFENYRDRRLTQTASRGAPGDRCGHAILLRFPEGPRRLFVVRGAIAHRALSSLAGCPINHCFVTVSVGVISIGEKESPATK